MNGDESLRTRAAPYPADVTAARFTLTPMGRRGYQPEEVDEFPARVAAELTRRDDLAEAQRVEADRYRDALRAWQSQQGQRQTTPTGAPEAEAVDQSAQARRQAEEQLTQTREYCRQLIEQTRVQARQLLDQARLQAAEPAEDGDRAAVDQGRERRLARARSSLDAVTAAGERLREAREQLASEVEELSRDESPDT